MLYHEVNRRTHFYLGRVGKKLSLVEIARWLKFSPSSVRREIWRISDADGHYTTFGTLRKERPPRGKLVLEQTRQNMPSRWAARPVSSLEPVGPTTLNSEKDQPEAISVARK